MNLNKLQEGFGTRAILFSLVMIGGLISLTIIILKPSQPDDENIKRRNMLSLHLAANPPAKEIILQKNVSPEKRDLNCRMYNCFNIYKCGDASDKITVYLYPLNKFIDEEDQTLSSQISQEFYDVYTAILDSEFYTDNPNTACLFIPPLDFLNQNNYPNTKTAGHILSSLDHWNRGSNHLIFNMLPGAHPEYSTVLEVPHDKAIIAGGGFSHWTYRPNFDVSIPIYSKVAAEAEPVTETFRQWLCVASQTNIHTEYRSELEEIAQNSGKYDLLLLEKCRNVPENVPVQQTRCQNDKSFSYPKILQEATFCLVMGSARLGQAALSEAMQSGCIPVFVSDSYIPPFANVLDWKRASVTIREEELSTVVGILKKIDPEQVKLMRSRVLFIYNKYFKSMKSIALTTLRVINDRIFPNKAWVYSQWNEPIGSGSVQSPLFLPLLSPEDRGFTVVILAYDRIDSLFEVIQSVDQVPSLKKILVIWNNQKESYPILSSWPVTKNPIKVIQTTANKLGNRFYPYDDIETEAIFAIDDDIVMLTTDEMEFAYQVWREFPDRLVGFPPRLHIINQTTGEVRYESEWKNDISIVLTGAAFYHKYYNHLYTYKMPSGVRDWVDDHMNCEDIAMNFLITNFTGKAPIKVAPRKKFTCPTCTNGLSVAKEHMVERSTCIKTFMKAYESLPLRSINFRADPVLYKDDFPDRLKSFPNMGSL